MGFTEAAFSDGEERLMEQALDSGHPWLAGIDFASLVRMKQQPLVLPRNDQGESLPFSSPEWFGTPDHRAQLLPVPVWSAPQESPSRVKGDDAGEAFPLQFLPRKADHYMNTTFANLPGHQVMERRSAGVLEMHPQDAEPRSLISGDRAEVWNGRGRIELQVRVAPTVAPGVVAARLDWQKLSPGGQNVNALTSQRLTDLGGGATFYSTLVEVRKVDAALQA